VAKGHDRGFFPWENSRAVGTVMRGCDRRAVLRQANCFPQTSATEFDGKDRAIFRHETEMWPGPKQASKQTAKNQTREKGNRRLFMPRA